MGWAKSCGGGGGRGRRGGRSPSSSPSQLFHRPIPTPQAKYSLKRMGTTTMQARYTEATPNLFKIPFYITHQKSCALLMSLNLCHCLFHRYPLCHYHWNLFPFDTLPVIVLRPPRLMSQLWISHLSLIYWKKSFLSLPSLLPGSGMIKNKTIKCTITIHIHTTFFLSSTELHHRFLQQQYA